MCLIRVSLKGLGSGGLVVEGVGLRGVEGRVLGGSCWI